MHHLYHLPLACGAVIQGIAMTHKKHCPGTYNTYGSMASKEQQRGSASTGPAMNMCNWLQLRGKSVGVGKVSNKI